MTAIKAFDRVKEVTTTTGTGSITLSGAVNSFRTFDSVLSINDECHYCIVDKVRGDWEIGRGRYTAENTLYRYDVYSSTNSGSLVDFASGNKDVFITDPASSSYSLDTKRELLKIPTLQSIVDTLSEDEEISFDHPASSAHKLLVSVFIDVHQNGLNDTSLDFETDSGYDQEDGSQTEIIGGSYKLKDQGGGTPALASPNNLTGDSSQVIASRTGDSGYEKWHTFDGNSGTNWYAGISDCWIGYDWGATHKLITQAKITGTGAWFTGSQWDLQRWNDGIGSWDTVASSGVMPNNGPYTFSGFDPVAPALKWRFFCTSSGSLANTQVVEVKFYEATTVYTTGTYYYVETEGKAIDLTTKSKINSISFDVTQPGSTYIYLITSFDGGTTWKIWNGSAWVVYADGLSDVGDGNVPADIVTGLTNYTITTETSLVFALAIATTDSTATPKINGITINYDEKPKFEIATIGNYDSSAQFGVRRIDDSTTNIKNKTGGSASIAANVVIFP